MSDAANALPSVYDGPPPAMYSPGCTVSISPAAATACTVFDESKFAAKRADASVAVKATTQRVQGASMRFFIVAGLALMELFALSARDADQTLLIAQCITVAFFGVLGLFAYRLNKGAFLVGMLVYGFDTLYLAYTGWQTSYLIVAYALVVRCSVIFRLYLAYGMICDLES